MISFERIITVSHFIFVACVKLRCSDFCRSSLHSLKFDKVLMRCVPCIGIGIGIGIRIWKRVSGGKMPPDLQGEPR